VKGHGAAALAAVEAGSAPRPALDHSHRSGPAATTTVRRPSRPVPVTIGRPGSVGGAQRPARRPVSACEVDPLAGFAAPGLARRPG